jgi:hypothetical protein
MQKHGGEGYPLPDWDLGHEHAQEAEKTASAKKYSRQALLAAKDRPNLNSMYYVQKHGGEGYPFSPGF